MAVWLGGGFNANQYFYMEPSVSTSGNAITFTLFIDNLLAFLPPGTIILADNAAIHVASFPVVSRRCRVEFLLLFFLYCFIYFLTLCSGFLYLIFSF